MTPLHPPPTASQVRYIRTIKTYLSFPPKFGDASYSPKNIVCLFYKSQYHNRPNSWAQRGRANDTAEKKEEPGLKARP